MNSEPGHLMTIGCHARDAEELAGPVMAKYVRLGGTATIIALTRGEARHPTKPPEVYGPQLEREMQESADILGAESQWLGFTSEDLADPARVSRAIGELIRHRKPDIVVTHWVGSLHPPHVSTHHHVLAGIRRAAAPSEASELPPHRVKAVYFGENLADLDGFVPNVFVDVSQTFDIWIEALSRYELYTRLDETGSDGTLSPSPSYACFYPVMATIRGQEIGCRYAKAFMRLREGRQYF